MMKVPPLMLSLNDLDCKPFLLAMLFTAGLKVMAINIWTLCIKRCILGKTETKVEKLQSIMAQLEYAYKINQFSSKGIPFKEHMYWRFTPSHTVSWIL